ncbi:MAG: hypothetical protein VST68_10230 [Nitrospirota bacterium]|nr:hypothetical protein [Nitrospirota bacterium]
MNIQEDHDKILKDLSTTMLDVARESVSLIKRSDQSQTVKLSQSQEWEIYLEFVKVMFNLVDRVSAFHLPIQVQPEFMNSLEDRVSDRLKTLLAPTLTSSQIDDDEITLSIGSAVAESRQIYERYKFVPTDESKEKDGYFQFIGERVATRVGANNSQAIISSAGLCARALIPAITALFVGTPPPQEEPATDTKTSVESLDQPTLATNADQPSTVSAQPDKQMIKLMSVIPSNSMEEIETRWGLFPQFRSDLSPQQVKELSAHMNQVSRIVGERFAVVSAKLSATSDQPTGHA